MKMYGVSPGDKAFIEKLTGIVHANLENENFGVNELAKLAGLSRNTLHRKLRSILSKPTCQFIREVRLFKARELLLTEGVTAAEVAYSVGFGSPSYFTTCFHEFFGYPPGKAIKHEVPTAPEPDNGLSEEKEPKMTGLIQRFKKRKAFRLAASVLVLGFILLQVGYLIITSRSSSYNFASITLGNRIRGMEKSIAVMPFKNLTDNKETGFFVEGVTEDINNQLQKIKDFRVVSRISVEQFRETILPVPKIAEKLNVNFLITGSIQKNGNEVVIHSELINARYDQVIWSQQFKFELSDIYRIQGEIAMQIAEKLQSQLSADELQKITKIPSANAEAISSYIKGRYYWSLRTEKDLLKSIEYFNRAIQADPNFALAYAGLADTYLYQYRIYAVPREIAFGMAQKMTDKALSLDDNLSEAYATKGVLFRSEWKWEESRNALEKAIRLKPDNAIAHQYYAETLHIMGEEEEAMRQIDLAITLNPSIPMMYYLRSSFLWHAGKCKEALETSQKIQTISPDYYSAHYQQGGIYHQLGDDRRAIESYKVAYGFFPETKVYVDSFLPAFEKDGWKGVVRLRIRIEKREKPVSHLQLSSFYLQLGENEKALNHLERALKNRDRGLPQILNSHTFEPLYGHPRFEKVRNDIGKMAHQVK